MERNYHTHTKLCGHAKGTTEDYVKEAVKKKLKALGMSEHGPFPGDAFEQRMKFADFRWYIENLQELKEVYKDQIEIFTGLEMEYIPDYDRYYRTLFEKYGIEYMILGQHTFLIDQWRYANIFEGFTDSSALVLYARSAMEGMRTGYFSYLAHPDLMFINDFGMDDNCRKAISIIIDEAEKKDYILELNANGFRRGKWKFAEGVRYPYPADAFWEEAAKAGIRVIIGSDCHSPCKLNDEYILETEQYAKKLGLQMIDRI